MRFARNLQIFQHLGCFCYYCAAETIQIFIYEVQLWKKLESRNKIFENDLFIRPNIQHLFFMIFFQIKTSLVLNSLWDILYVSLWTLKVKWKNVDNICYHIYNCEHVYSGNRKLNVILNLKCGNGFREITKPSILNLIRFRIISGSFPLIQYVSISVARSKTTQKYFSNTLPILLNTFWCFDFFILSIKYCHLLGIRLYPSDRNKRGYKK